MIQIQESINHYASGIAKRRTTMINLKKHDPVADAVSQILQQEALKGNQDKIDANHNGKIDGEDFKILRAKKKKVEEEIDTGDRTEDTPGGRKKTKQSDDVGPGSDAKVTKFKLKSEEVVSEEEKDLAKTSPVAVNKTEKPEPQEVKDKNKEYENKKQLRMKEDTERLEEKNWIAKAIKKPGSETAAAKKAGMSVQAYAEKHKHDSGKAGKRARLAITLKHMKEKFEEPILDDLINEVMSKDASAGDYIHDFVHSDNPKFAGKSTAKRKEMALAAYYSKKNEEVVNEGLKDVAKKAFTALTGGSDKDHLDRLKKDMYGGSEVKYAAKTLVKHAKDPLGLKKEEVVEEGWDDMVKDAQEKVKSGPKPSGGSGKKEGSRYGGSKQSAEKPEGAGYSDLEAGKTNWKKENDLVKTLKTPVKEAKDPMMDAGCGSQPDFATNDSKPMKHAQTLAKKSLGRMRNEMLGKIAN